jgi:hypothetical protein
MPEHAPVMLAVPKIPTEPTIPAFVPGLAQMRPISETHCCALPSARRPELSTDEILDVFTESLLQSLSFNGTQVLLLFAFLFSVPDVLFGALRHDIVSF